MDKQELQDKQNSNPILAFPLTLDELQKKFPLKFRIVKDYIYDLKGEKYLWDKLLNTHDSCTAFFEGGIMVFACYNCKNINCYFITDKEKMKKEGAVYHE